MIGASTIVSSSGRTVLDLIHVFVILLAVVAAAEIVARRTPLPTTVILVVVGLAVGFVAPTRFEFTPQLVLTVLLPGLVFEAAYDMEAARLRHLLTPVFLLAVPGVLIVAGVVAVVLHVAAGLPLREGLLVGAMVAATDPVSIVATFRRLRAPRSLAVLVEAESLFNDGTSIVLFSLALAALSSPVDLPGAAVAFIGTIAISVSLGAVAGFVVSRAIAHVDDRAIEATVSIVLAYGIYLLADALGESGVIATVMAGLTLGTYGRSIGMTERTVEALDVVWDLLAFILTAVAFLVVGMGITLDELGKAAIPAAWAILGVMVARAVIVYGLVGGWRLLSHSGQRPLAPRWLHVLFWAGLRGAVTVALALSLPDDLPDRRLLQGITFTVVLFTLLVQGSTAGQLMELIGLGKEPAAAGATSGRAGPA